jgi:hypothetical protein
MKFTHKETIWGEDFGEKKTEIKETVHTFEDMWPFES